MLRHLFGLITAALLLGQPAHARTDAPVVAAASDLQFALEDVAAAFTAASGQRVRLSFGSSGNFHRQIAQAGPFQVFLSADESYVLDLAQKGLTTDEGALYAIGRIALVVPKRAPLLAADGSLADLRRALSAGQITKFAIANPDHAPYGRAAKEALEHSGLWGDLQGRLVLGENVSQAAQFATSGATQGGIVAYSLAMSPQLSALADHALIPEDWHAPLRQRMALVKGAGPVAAEFYAFVQSPPARDILTRYGFTLPEGN